MSTLDDATVGECCGPDVKAGSGLTNSTPDCLNHAGDDIGGAFNFDAGAPIVAKPAIESESRVVAPVARLSEIEAIFDHADLKYFARAELAAEYVEISEHLEFGQDVQKGPGRPGIISKTASALTLPGKTDAACLKWLQRPLKIAGISTAAKAAARRRIRAAGTAPCRETDRVRPNCAKMGTRPPSVRRRERCSLVRLPAPRARVSTLQR